MKTSTAIALMLYLIVLQSCTMAVHLGDIAESLETIASKS